MVTSDKCYQNLEKKSGYKESDVLYIVWNAIYSDYFKQSSKDIIKILIEEIYYSLDLTLQFDLSNYHPLYF